MKIINAAGLLFFGITLIILAPGCPARGAEANGTATPEGPYYASVGACIPGECRTARDDWGPYPTEFDCRVRIENIKRQIEELMGSVPVVFGNERCSTEPLPGQPDSRT